MVAEGVLGKGFRVPKDWEFYSTHGTIDCEEGDIILWTAKWTCAIPEKEWEEVGEEDFPIPGM